VSSAKREYYLADRLGGVGFSEIVIIRNKILSLKAAGQHIFQFEGGEPFAPTPQVIKAACGQALNENKTRYAPSSGIPELINLLAEKLRHKNKIPTTKEHVVVVVGGMQGLFTAFQTLLNPKDEVLLFSPYWTPTKDLIALMESNTKLVNTLQARQQGLTAALAAQLTPRTKALCLSSPQNPTGQVFTRAEITEIANFVKEHNLLVISDEAYEDIVYDGEHVSIASLPEMYERTISTFTFSKSYSMTGWRLGYVVAPEPFIEGIKQSVLYSTNGVSTPVQWAGVAAIQQCEDFIQENLVEYRRRRDLLVGGLQAVGFECPLPAGAFYAFPKFSKLSNLNSRDFATLLLEKASVATVPGSVFGPDGEGYLRFSYSLSVDTIEQGLLALRCFLGK
jgi:aspartate aminotransferase